MSRKQGPSRKHHPGGITVLHEDKDILVVEKPPGLLTVSTGSVRSRTLYHKLTDYVRRGNAKSRERIFIVHRLDREASGILVFARNQQAKLRLQGRWPDSEKKYLAVVYGKLTPKSGTITSHLAENKAHRVYSTKDAATGKLSHTRYAVLEERKWCSLLEVHLLTGRKHQIRVHLAESGHPIVGDTKYGNPDRRHKRLALHAQSLSFHHPSSGKRMTFQTDRPRYFSELIGAPSK